MKKKVLNKLKIAVGVLGLIVLGLLVYGLIKEGMEKFGLIMALLI